MLPQVEALENLECASGEVEQIEWNERGKLPYETVNGSIKQIPTSRCFDTRTHYSGLAFSRSAAPGLRREPDAGRAALQKAKILLFRIATAFRHMEHPKLRDALRRP
ncbi:hypothetical protein [Paenibacillus tarimensis]|uniref:hypothetical protein n=1 Tax=Paenibacillus tarimensis TaxID=416012 RepID=UPI001F48E52E|nr:hypothetical protein [Paenibacillus tarimensis]MCF2946322.1 hypothetical protein [Paenibacillus tarimensis]